MRTKAEFVPGQGIVRRPHRSPRLYRVRLDQAQAQRLQEHADRRNLDVDAMLNLIMKMVFNDNLIDAVVDDGKENIGAAGVPGSC